MDSDSRAIVIVLLLFVGAIYCAITETAFASVSKNKIKIKADKGEQKAKIALKILDDFDDAITTLLICTNICHISAASCVTAYVTKKWGLSAVTASTFIMTIAMFLIGEMLPKSIGKKIGVQVCLFTAGLLSVLMKIFKPVAKLLSAIGELTLKLVRGGEEVSVTEEEIYDIIEDMTEEGTLDEERSELISSALSFGDLTVSSILTPRVDVEGFDINMSPEEVLEFISGQNHSRLVVYDKSIDNIVGVLQIRRFLKHYVNRKTIPNVHRMMDNVYYAHQSMPIDELLTNMSKQRLNMAVVLDGFGGTLGIVTIEDILEEIVGEIWDEDDEIDEPFVQLGDDVYSVSGDETVGSLFDEIDFEETDEEEEQRFTNLIIADWVYEQLGKIPSVGDSFNHGNLTVAVEEIEHNRIRRVKVTINPEDDSDSCDAQKNSGKDTANESVTNDLNENLNEEAGKKSENISKNVSDADAHAMEELAGKEVES